MRSIAVVGAGKIGSTIAQLLGECGEYDVLVIDRDDEQLERLPPEERVSRLRVDIDDEAALGRALAGRYAVLNAGPFSLTTRIAAAAKGAGAHYLDLTEDVASTRAVRALAEGADTAFVPQCGLAPGFITIVANELAGRFDTLLDVRMRVGALPRYPTNALGYNLTWSTDGVINEYCEPCEAIVDGRLVHTMPLEEEENFTLDGVAYEAFNTSGGLGSMCDTLLGRVRNLNYRTIRYPGHAAVMRTLLNDLRLRERRPLLKDILEHAIPVTDQDVVIVFTSVTGERGGRLVQESDVRHVHSGTVGGRRRSAIQITTASAICAVLDLLAGGALPGRGFVRQEQVSLSAFLHNRFGRAYS
ncbi:MAG: saccharopine dehydrogenase NADP-binding domain-containing protein [Gluconacetobacter diazotrophicus]|nr:saccharopine dehydrogenase NADP-binding domain-containing protein [Gluconacetobacter diazotrophicus]